MKDYKKILKGVVNIIATTEKTDIGFANICSYLSANCDELFENEDITKAVDWLKSLRPQNRWKPSKEQMEALEHFIVYHNGSTNYAKDLEELRLQLKKLK